MMWMARNNFYLLASLLGVLQLFKQIREHKVNDLSIFEECNVALQTVLQTPVPGMDDYLKANRNEQ
jgi:hypothetical protein